MYFYDFHKSKRLPIPGKTGLHLRKQARATDPAKLPRPATTSEENIWNLFSPRRPALPRNPWAPLLFSNDPEAFHEQQQSLNSIIVYITTRHDRAFCPEACDLLHPIHRRQFTSETSPHDQLHFPAALCLSTASVDSSTSASRSGRTRILFPASPTPVDAYRAA